MLGGWSLNRWSGLSDLCWGDVCLLRVFQVSWLREPQTWLLFLTWDGWVFVLCSCLSSLSSCSSCFSSWMVIIERSLSWWVQSEPSIFSVRGPDSRLFLNVPGILSVFVLGIKTQIVKKKNISAHLQGCVCVFERERESLTLCYPHTWFSAAHFLSTPSLLSSSYLLWLGLPSLYIIIIVPPVLVSSCPSVSVSRTAPAPWVRGSSRV